MSLYAPTQYAAMNLITAIVTQEESKITELVASDITLTTEHNGGKPVVRQGRDQYIGIIKAMWAHAMEYNHGSFSYKAFTSESGEVHFRQICEVLSEKGPRSMLSEGVQLFTFNSNRIITAIKVIERDTLLTNEDFSKIVASTAAQSSKIADSAAASASLGQKFCAIM
jgi:hypothetical protein